MRGGGFRDSINISKVTIDADLNLAAHKIICAEVDTDVIAEKTGAAGITLNHRLKADEIQEKTGAAGVSLFSVVKADDISERTGANGVKIGSVLKTDHIAEKTASHGVVADTIVSGFVRTVTASDNLKQSQDTTTSAAYANWFGNDAYIFTLPASCAGGGTVRIKSDLRGTVAGSIYKAVFVKGVYSVTSSYPAAGAFGQPTVVTKTVTTGYVTYADDVSIPAGTTTIVVLFQNYLYGTDTGYAQNVRLYYDVV